MTDRNKIDIQLQKLRSKKTIGLMTHVVVGYPSIEDTPGLVQALVNGGSNFIELQIPFSDPVADGPTIMEACETALANGATTDIAFETAGELAAQVGIPLLFMAYYNTIYRYGVEEFCKYAAKIGISGLIVPDIPPDEEEEEHFIEHAMKHGLYPIRVISPASTPERLKLNAEVAKGFVYCVSHFGTTGTKLDIGKELDSYLDRVRRHFDIPVALGFGISKTSDVNRLKGKVDIAVVGSAIIREIERGASDGKVEYAKVEKLIKALNQSQC